MADSMRGSCTFFSSNTVNILVPDGGHTFMVRTKLWVICVHCLSVITYVTL